MEKTTDKDGNVLEKRTIDASEVERQLPTWDLDDPVNFQGTMQK